LTVWHATSLKLGPRREASEPKTDFGPIRSTLRVSLTRTGSR